MAHSLRFYDFIPLYFIISFPHFSCTKNTLSTQLSVPRASLHQYLFQNPAITGDGYHLPREEFAAVFQGRFCGSLEATAAWHLHTENSYALYIILTDDFRQLLTVISLIQLWTANHGYFPFHEILMDIGIGIGGTIRCNQQLGPVIKWCLSWEQLYLTWPLIKPGH